eukprot:1153377-Pelagomonas_calceolata.AAC.1
MNTSNSKQLEAEWSREKENSGPDSTRDRRWQPAPHVDPGTPPAPSRSGSLHLSTSNCRQVEIF